MNQITNIVIRIVGNWNIKIFTPDWVSKILLNSPIENSLEIEFNQELQPSFLFKKVRITPNDSSIDIYLFEFNEESKNLAIQIILNLLTALPYTPKLAIGFNYKIKLSEKLDLKTIPIYSDMSVASLNLFKIEKDFQLNLSIENLFLNYNFHISNVEIIKKNIIDFHLEYIKNYENPA